MKHLALLVIILAAAGCAGFNAPVKNASDLSGYKTFQVPQQTGDNLGLAALIAAELNAAGLETGTDAGAVIGYRVEPVPGSPARIAKLVLQVTDVKTGQVVGRSRSEQPASLMPSTNRAMVEIAVRNLLAATPVSPGGHARGSMWERETLF